MIDKTQEAKDQVIEEVLYLYYTGYDGPFMGEPVERLFRALAKLDKIKEK